MARQKRTQNVKKMLPLIPQGGSGGVTDHGDLSGLGDDDHPQYAKTTDIITDHGALAGLGDDDHPQYVNRTTAQTIAGVKTFSSFPVTPSSAPSTSYQAVNKKYVDDTLVTALTRYAVRAYRDNSAFAFTTSGTIYTIPLNQENYDTHNQHDNSTNNSRLTCVKAGMYLINATLTFAKNATGNRDLLLMKNGTTYFAQQRLQAFASGSCTLNTFAAIPLAVGDYVEMRGRQYSGGSLSMYYADDTNNYMAMVRIGD